MLDDLEALRRENEALRERLDAVEANAKRARERQRWVMDRGGSLMVPLMDRQRVARNFVALFRLCAGYAGTRDGWPPKEDVVAAAEAFTTSMVRFFIRRRLLYLGLSVAALAIPAIQVVLLVQQNRIINLQNSLIAIQADDIVARGVTSENVVTNQINGALLANRNLHDLVGMIRRIFGADVGEQFLLTPEARRLALKTTGGRGHLLLALNEAIKSPGGESAPSVSELWHQHLADQTEGALPEILRDGANRAFLALTTPRSAFVGADASLEAECQRYLYGLVSVLRQAHALAVSNDDRETYYALIAETFRRLAQANVEDAPLRQPFALMSQELLIDVAQDRRYRGPEPSLDNVDAALATGFKKLQAGIGPRAQVNWGRLRGLMGLK